MSTQSVRETAEVLAIADASLPRAIRLIDEKLIKKTPTAVPGHCLIGPLKVLGLPMFTNSKLSTCHRLPDGLPRYVTDIRENTKSSPPLLQGARERGVGVWEECGWREEGAVMRPVVWDHGVRLTFLIHRSASQCAAWIYKLERTCSTITTSDLRALTSAWDQSSG